MRAAAVLLLLVLLAPPAAAAIEHYHRYVMHGYGCQSGGLAFNCVHYPAPVGVGNASALAADVSGATVRVRICHEWTFDDGSHAVVSCDVGCDATSSAMRYPTRAGSTYRVFVDLRNGPGACERAATAGELWVRFA